MQNPRISNIELEINKENYFFRIPLENNVYLAFEKRNKQIPENTLNLNEENSNISIPLKFNTTDFEKNLDELYPLENYDPKKIQDCLKERTIFLAKLCMNLQEERVELFKDRLITASKIADEYSEEFLESQKYGINRLKLFGNLEAATMRNVNSLAEKALNGKVSKRYNNEIDFYSQLYIGWSFLKDASKEFSTRLNRDANFLEKTLDPEVGARLKEVSHFYSQLSGHSQNVEEKLQLLITRAMVIYGIKLNKIKYPKLGVLKEKIKDKLFNFEVPESWKPFL